MCRILNFQRNSTKFASNLVRRSRGIAFAVTAAVTLCLGANAQAQTLAQQQLVPTAANMQDAPVSSAVALDFNDEAAVNAAYSVLNDISQVEPASYRGQGGRRSRAHHSHVAANPCNAGCDVSFYVNAESLWLDRTGDDFFSLSRNTFLPEFDYEWGGRYSAGQLLDCVNGWEGVYVGPFDWTRGLAISGAGNLQSNLRAFNGYTSADIDTFNNADLHSQQWRSEMQSFEANRRWFTWDVLSTMIGVRYIDYEENYAFFSSSAQGVGLQRERVTNQMAGLQVGADMVYPMSLRANMGFRGKAGVYGNFQERRAFLNNAGTTLINAADGETTWGGQLEIGILANYHIVPSIRVTAGYEFWWLANMATIPGQGPSLITPATGTTVFDGEDVILHGGSLGAQILF